MIAILSNSYVFLGLAAVCLWYYIKYLVHQNGYETHLFWGHFGDIQNLRALVNKEQDAGKKSRFQTLLYAFYASLILALASFAVTFIIR